MCSQLQPTLPGFVQGWVSNVKVNKQHYRCFDLIHIFVCWPSNVIGLDFFFYSSNATKLGPFKRECFSFKQRNFYFLITHQLLEILSYFLLLHFKAYFLIVLCLSFSIKMCFNLNLKQIFLFSINPHVSSPTCLMLSASHSIWHQQTLFPDLLQGPEVILVSTFLFCALSFHHLASRDV